MILVINDLVSEEFLGKISEFLKANGIEHFNIVQDEVLMLDEIKKLEKREAELSENLTGLSGQIADLTSQIFDANSSLNKVNANRGEVQNQLDGLNKQLETANADLENIRKHILSENEQYEKLVALREEAENETPVDSGSTVVKRVAFFTIGNSKDWSLRGAVVSDGDNEQGLAAEMPHASRVIIRECVLPDLNDKAGNFDNKPADILKSL